MIVIQEYTSGKTFICKLNHGGDLIDSIHKICREKSITLAQLQGIGALKNANIAFYDQANQTYEQKEFQGEFEILSLIGNISLKDGEPICHAHLVFGNEKGEAYGGHLLPGCMIYACELIITELKGNTLKRGLDKETGLPLWE